MILSRQKRTIGEFETKRVKAIKTSLILYVANSLKYTTLPISTAVQLFNADEIEYSQIKIATPILKTNLASEVIARITVS